MKKIIYLYIIGFISFIIEYSFIYQMFNYNKQYNVYGFDISLLSIFSMACISIPLMIISCILNIIYTIRNFKTGDKKIYLILNTLIVFSLISTYILYPGIYEGLYDFLTGGFNLDWWS